MRSTADIARELGVTVQAVNKYRRRVEKQVGKQIGSADLRDKRRTLFDDAEFEQIKALAPMLPRETVEAEIIDGEDVEVVHGPTSALALRHSSLPAVQRQRFDIAAAQSDLRGIDAHSVTVASRLDSLMSEFAVGEFQGAMAEIQRTIATVKANALGDALAAVGKPVAQTD
jgi:hypothetical protein